MKKVHSLCLKKFYYKSALTTILVKITHYLLDSTQFVKLGVHASNHVKWNPYSYFTSLLSLLKQIVKSKKQTCYSITREILQTSSLIQWRKIIFKIFKISCILSPNILYCACNVYVSTFHYTIFQYAQSRSRGVSTKKIIFNILSFLTICFLIDRALLQDQSDGFARI